MKQEITPYGTATILEGNQIPSVVGLETQDIGGRFGTIYIDKKQKKVYGFNGYQCFRYSLKDFKRSLKFLTKEHTPKYIRCYDNGGETADRYTVVFTGRYDKKANGYCYVGMSGDPFHPQGIGMHGEHSYFIDKPSYKHLGKKIKFDDLTERCQQLVMRDYADLYEFSGIVL